MPDLDTELHLRMLRDWKGEDLYGLHWGDPDQVEHLKMVRHYYLSFFIDATTTVVEIGPGGGRWTRYMLGAQRIYAVDFHQELLDELQKLRSEPNIFPIKNNGADFPGVPDHSVDFVFSFGVFVHLELDIIEAYLKNMARILKPTANVVLQYSDQTKPRAQSKGRGFSDNTPEKMTGLIRRCGYTIQDDNRWLLPNAAIVRFTP